MKNLIGNILNDNKIYSYEFSQEGFEKAKRDCKSRKIGKIIDIGFWTGIGLFGVCGIINYNLIIKMVACTGTSKTVKLLMH